MTSFIEQLNAAAGHWTGLMLAVLWQSTVLALVIALVALAVRRSSPAVRYWLWQILAIKLLVMPFWTVAVPWSDWFGLAAGRDVGAVPRTGAIEPGVPRGRADGPGVQPPLFLDGAAPGSAAEPPRWFASLTWQAGLLLGWAVIIMWQAVRIALQRRRLRLLLSAARPADPDVAAPVRSVALELRLRRVPDVRLADAGCSPFVCGLRRPILVLPENLAGTLDAKQFRHVLFHELAHVKRRDLLWGWIPEIAWIVYFFHPVAHWLTWRLRLERELACDQIAMSHTGRDARAYADTLVQVVSRQSEPLMFKAAVAGCVPPEETRR